MSVIETPVEIKVEEPVRVEPVVEDKPEEPVVEEIKPEPTPEPAKTVNVDRNLDFDNLWDVFRRK